MGIVPPLFDLVVAKLHGAVEGFRRSPKRRHFAFFAAFDDFDGFSVELGRCDVDDEVAGGDEAMAFSVGIVKDELAIDAAIFDAVEEFRCGDRAHAA